MSKMIKEMKELENKYVIDEAFNSACAVRRCIEIAKKYKKKKKYKKNKKQGRPGSGNGLGY